MLKKKNNTSFIILILLLSFSNVFAISGYATMMHYTEIMTCLTLVIFLMWLAVKSQCLNISTVGLSLFLLCVVYGMLILFHWKDIRQLANLLTLLGGGIWLNLFFQFQWDEERYRICGIVCSIYSILMIALFLPGSVLSGWNANSPICVLPTVFFALSCLQTSKMKRKNFISFLVVLATGGLILRLENRSALFSLVLFLIVFGIRKKHSTRRMFRAFYISVIALNLLLPLFFQIATATPLFQFIAKGLSDVFEKSGLNGREEVWTAAVAQISKNPILGNYGYRTTYFHNFSLDILTQFGWIGWIAFFGTLIFFLEKHYRPNDTKNLFLIGFLCLIFLNTFENVLFCNNCFMPFPYLLLTMNKRSER